MSSRRFWARGVVMAMAGVLLGWGQARGAEAVARFTVEAGKQARINTPVSVALEGLGIGQGPVELVEIAGPQRLSVPCQLEEGATPRLSWILSGTTPAGATRVFELQSGAKGSAERVEVKPDQDGLEIAVGGAKVLRFHSAVMAPPKGAAKEYARSGFIHPLWAPNGAVLTRIHAPDHIHHLGIWNPWTSTEFEGRKVDFWNIKDKKGTVRFVKFLSQTSGPVFGGFKAAMEHVDLSAPGGEKVALNEEQEIRVWNVGGDAGYYLVDFITTQRCASASPLLLLKYRYGGLGFRATAEWQSNNSDYLTSEGKNRQTGHGTRGRWCNIFGTTGKGPAGIEFMSHPANRDHPEPMRIWPESNVFFNFCPIQAKEWKLEPGNDYTLRYRMYVYSGTISPETCERLWQDFGNPPTVKVEKR